MFQKKNLSISLDKKRNLFITGKFNHSTADHGTYGGAITFYHADQTVAKTLTPEGKWQGFLAKYDKDGNVKWARKFTSSENVEPYSISNDRHGNVYVTGDSYTNVSVTFYSSNGLDNIILSSGGDDAFLVKYDGDGNIKWAASQTSTGVEYTVPNSVSSYYYLEEVQ